MASDDEPTIPALEGLHKVNGSGIGDNPYDGLLVTPNIVPAGYRFRQVRGPGHLALVLELHTPTGMHITFWPEKSSQVFAGQFQRVANATAAGLMLHAHKLNVDL